MGKRRVTWFVVADGSRARFLTRREDRTGYEIVAEYESPEARSPARDLGSDYPGRTQESATSGRHAIEPREDLHQARKASFVRDVASHLNNANARENFDALILFAAPRSLAQLRNALNDPTQKKIKAEFPKDLTNTPMIELPRHFDDFT
jgi:protein required for attachment to host cells